MTTPTLVAAAGARALVTARRGLPPGWGRPWERTNHAGRAVTLLEGPAAVLGALAGVAATPHHRGPAGAVVLVPGLLGALDDLVGDTATKGLRGHLAALHAGRVTTGALKVLGLGAVALVTAATEQRAGGPPSSRLGQTAVDTVVIAGTGNLVNLLDLRPGRALKVTTAAGALLLLPTGSRPLAGALLGTGAGLLPEDLAGESMLGDCGANALGALLGLALVRGLGPRGRLTTAATVTGLTLLSERVSFTRVIESTPVLRELDAWGRPR